MKTKQPENVLIPWSKEYELNIEEIDNQHKKLVDILNELLSKIRTASVEQSTIDSILDKLVNYTRYHFKTEEEFMLKNNYRYYREHSIQHEELVGKLSEFLIHNEIDENFDSVELLRFLEDWLINHIIKEDKKIAELV